jgi:hypothetical protein
MTAGKLKKKKKKKKKDITAVNGRQPCPHFTSTYLKTYSSIHLPCLSLNYQVYLLITYIFLHMYWLLWHSIFQHDHLYSTIERDVPQTAEAHLQQYLKYFPHTKTFENAQALFQPTYLP